MAPSSAKAIARRKRVLQHNSPVAIATIIVAGLLSLLFATLLCYVSINYLPYWANYVKHKAVEFIDTLSVVSVVRRYITPQSNISMDVFTDNYLNLELPVVLTTGPSYDNKRIQQLFDLEGRHMNISCTISTIVNSDDSVIEIRTIPNLKLSSYRHRSTNTESRSNIIEYIWNDRDLVSRIGHEEIKNWLKNARPAMLQQNDGMLLFDSFDDPNPGMSMSLLGHGTNFMQSRAFLNVLIEGSQHWLLFKSDKLPHSGIHPFESLSQWTVESYPHVNDDLTPLEATLHAGDTLFVPEGYLYAYQTSSNISTSIQLFKKSEEIGGPYHLQSEGKRKMDRGEFKSAKSLYVKAGALDGGRNYALLEELGFVLERLQDYEGAEEHYKKSLLKNKRHPLAYERLASLLIERKKLDAARATMKLAVKNNAATRRLLKLNETLEFLLL